MFTLIAVVTAVAAFEFAVLRYGADSRLDVRDANARQGATARWL
jgi:hypothetical protein